MGLGKAVASTLAAVLILGASAAGCGGDDENGSAGGQAAPAETSQAEPVAASEVSMGEYRFEPASVVAEQGAELTVENAGAIQHDLKLRKDGEEVGGTELVDAGESTTFKVDAPPGDYEMFCSVAGHEDSGMKGTFKVE